VKGKLLIVASAILAGCSNTPSSGDIEKAVQGAVASCRYVEAVDVKKTNGVQDDGYYRVDYTYRVRLKDSGVLKKLQKTWMEEKRRNDEYITARAAYEEKERAITNEIEAIKASFSAKFPREEDFSLTRRYDLEGSKENIAAYKAAVAAHYSEESAARAPKEKELDELKREWDKSRSEVPSPFIFGNEGHAMYVFYREGCSSNGIKYIEGLSQAHAELVDRSKDVNLWFEAQEVNMNGVMPMRKTENGWRRIE
jgi:flavin-binding protein dodecin